MLSDGFSKHAERDSYAWFSGVMNIVANFVLKVYVTGTLYASHPGVARRPKLNSDPTLSPSLYHCAKLRAPVNGVRCLNSNPIYMDNITSYESAGCKRAVCDAFTQYMCKHAVVTVSLQYGTNRVRRWNSNHYYYDA